MHSVITVWIHVVLWEISSNSLLCSCEFVNLSFLTFVLTLNWWDTTLNSVRWYVLVKWPAIPLMCIYKVMAVFLDNQFRLTMILASDISLSLHLSCQWFCTLIIFSTPFSFSLHLLNKLKLILSKVCSFAFYFFLSLNKTVRVLSSLVS